jgi:hypothetical protein
MRQIKHRRAEQPFVNPRMSKGARDKEIGILRVGRAAPRRRSGRQCWAKSEMCSALTSRATEGEPRHLSRPFEYRRGVMAAMRLAPRA